MDTIERIALEMFGDEEERGRFRWLSKIDRQKSYHDRSDYGLAMNPSTLEQIIKSDDIEYVDPAGLRQNVKFDNLYQCLQQVKYEWEDSNVNMQIFLGGNLSEEHTWIDTVWIFYENETKDATYREHFEEEMVLRFKSSLRDEFKSVCPTCDDRVTISNDHFRYVYEDPSLYATTDEFDFRFDEDRGHYLRLWWDD